MNFFTSRKPKTTGTEIINLFPRKVVLKKRKTRINDMKQIYLAITLALAAGGASAQTVYWMESFDVGYTHPAHYTGGWVLTNPAYVGGTFNMGHPSNPTPGSTVGPPASPTTVGAAIPGLTYNSPAEGVGNKRCNNYWVINDANTPNASMRGVRYGTPPASACVPDITPNTHFPFGGTQNRSLHITAGTCNCLDTYVGPGSFEFVQYDQVPGYGDAYQWNDDPWDPLVDNQNCLATSDQWAYMNAGIDNTGKCKSRLRFDAFLGGANNGWTQRSVLYSIDGGATWKVLVADISSGFSAFYNPCGNWRTYTYNLPAECDGVADLRFAFRWRNFNGWPQTTADGTGAGGMNVDNIRLIQPQVPDAVFTANPLNQCRGQMFTLTNTSVEYEGTPVTYTWIVPNTDLTIANAGDFDAVNVMGMNTHYVTTNKLVTPQISYSTVGSRIITLQAVNCNGDADPTPMSVVINVSLCPPIPNLASTERNVCIPAPPPSNPFAPTSVAFTGFDANTTVPCTGGCIKWTWYFTPAAGVVYINGTNANSPNPEVRFTASGLYDVTLSVENDDGTTVITRPGFITAVNCECYTAPPVACANYTVAFDEEFNTDLVPGGVFRFNDLTINAGAVMRLRGSVPAIIEVQGTLTVNGLITANGVAGSGTTGGAGGPGGAAGGAGGAPFFNGLMGGGLGAGQGGKIVCLGNGNGGGGGAYGGAGGIASQTSDGGGGVCGPPTTGGSPYGDVPVTTAYGGSGGGGGAGDADSNNGGGGGGGGGSVTINATNVNIAATGVIESNGGQGGLVTGFFLGPGCGGGGSGGSIVVNAGTVINNGIIRANGGRGGGGGPLDFSYGGGGGGGGRIRINYVTSFTGTGTLQANGGSRGTGDGTCGVPCQSTPGTPGSTSSGTIAAIPPFGVCTGGGGGMSFDYGGCGLGNIVFATSQNIVGAVYEYDNITVNAGVVLTVTGPNPLHLKACGTLTINGTIRADGTNGTAGASGGAGGAGGGGGGHPGGNGVTGGATAAECLFGNPGGGGNLAQRGGGYSGGGGGGHGGNGGNGSRPTGSGFSCNAPCTGGCGIAAYGDAPLTVFTVGIGGAAGGSQKPTFGSAQRSGGGGGGGGRIRLTAPAITINAGGIVSANGGAGGAAAGSCGSNGCGGGGGGAGGAIWLESPAITNNGTVRANGGAGGACVGGGGGGGRIRRDGTVSGAGTFTVAGGAGTTASFGLPASQAGATGTIHTVSGGPTPFFWVGGAAGNETRWDWGPNWNPPSIPGSSAEVIIPQRPYMPILSVTAPPTGTLNSITIESKASLRINTGGTLNVAAVTNNGLLRLNDGNANAVNVCNNDSIKIFNPTRYLTVTGFLKNNGTIETDNLHPGPDVRMMDSDAASANNSRYEGAGVNIGVDYYIINTPAANIQTVLEADLSCRSLVVQGNLVATSKVVTLKKDYDVQSGTVTYTGSTFVLNGDGSNTVLHGGNPQSLYANAVQTFNNLFVEKPDGFAVLANNTFRVSNVLRFACQNAAYVDANGHVLQLINSAPGSLERVPNFADPYAGHVVGQFRRSLVSTGVFEFPLGMNGLFAPEQRYERAQMDVKAITAGFMSNVTGRFLAVGHPTESILFNESSALPVAGVDNPLDYQEFIPGPGYWNLSPNADPTSINYDLSVWPNGFSGPSSPYWTYARRRTYATTYPWGLRGTKSATAWPWVRRTGLAGFSDVAPVQSLDPLPVESTPLAAQALSNEIRLTWQTLSERSNKGFEIERGTDGETFVKVGYVEGAGNSREAKNYLFDDPAVQRGIVYYYRYKQLDFDGRHAYSNVAQALLPVAKGKETLQALTVYPNPFKGTVTFNYSLGKATHLTLEIYDLNGKLVATPLKNAGVKTSGEKSVDLSSLSPGVYVYRLKAGTEAFTGKLVRE